MEHLERDRPVVLEVLGEVDRGHPSAAELALDAVAICQGGLQVGQCVGQEENLRGDVPILGSRLSPGQGSADPSPQLLEPVLHHHQLRLPRARRRPDR
jgi:hypothetical protein